MTPDPPSNPSPNNGPRWQTWATLIYGPDDDPLGVRIIEYRQLGDTIEWRITPDIPDAWR